MYNFLVYELAEHYIFDSYAHSMESYKYADDVNLLGEGMHIMIAEDLLVAIRETGLELNADGTKRMFMSYQQNAGKNHNTKSSNKTFETVARLTHLGVTLTNQNCTDEGTDSRSNSGNA
jgi:hypothetical protein